MNFKEYQQLAMRTANPDLTEAKRHIDSAMGMSGEAGEVSDIIKKVYFQGHPFTMDSKTKIIEEMGDVMWYIAQMCQTLNINMEDVAVINIRKLEKRYPNLKFELEHTLNRKPEVEFDGTRVDT